MLRRTQSCTNSLEDMRRSLASTPGVTGVFRGHTFEVRHLAPKKTGFDSLVRSRWQPEPVVVGRLLETESGRFVEYGLRLEPSLLLVFAVYLGIILLVPGIATALMLSGATVVVSLRFLAAGKDLFFAVSTVL